MTYNAFVDSLILYSIEIYGETYQTHLSILIMLTNKQLKYFATPVNRNTCSKFT